MTPKKIADMRERMDESTWDDRWCDRSVCEDAISALEASLAREDDLRRQVEELGDVVPPPGFEVSEYAAIHHIGMLLGFPKICKRGPGAWAAFFDDCACIGKDAELHYELSPSNRTPEFIALTRFATPHAAARALRSGDAAGGGGAA